MRVFGEDRRIFEPAADVARHDPGRLVRVGLEVADRRVPGAGDGPELVLALREDVRPGEQPVDEQAGALRAVGQEVAVVGGPPLREPGFPRHGRIDLLQQEGFAGVFRGQVHDLEVGLR